MKKNENKIIINLNHNDDAANKFNNDILSKDLGDYIYDQYVRFKTDGKIKIQISSDEEMDNNFKNKLKHMIMDNISSNIVELNKIHKSLYIKSFLLAIIGICLIIVAHLFNLYNLSIAS